jgi:hypothetical protein
MFWREETMEAKRRNPGENADAEISVLFRAETDAETADAARQRNAGREQKPIGTTVIKTPILPTRAMAGNPPLLMTKTVDINNT